MRFAVFGAVFLLVLVASTLVLVEVLPEPAQPDVLVGVDVAFGGEEDVYRVANAVRGFANLIVVGSTVVTSDTAKLTRVCEYLYKHGFSFIVYVGFAKEGYFPPNGPGPEFFNTTTKRWGTQFLGAYIFDEIGGKQLDYNVTNPDKPVTNAIDYSDAAEKFVHLLHSSVDLYKNTYYMAPDLKTFTSDYGLYWFDYLFGYNAVFGEFVGNQSRQLTIARCRGAANVQNMTWGTMITWKYDQAPFLESGTELYRDMKLAYDNGADYVVVFDGSENQTATSNFGTLQPEHLDAMKQFWNYARFHERPKKDPADTAYVLPRDYGFGFRGPNDNIWGLWPADALAPKIWNEANSLLSTYGPRLDIVYETLSKDLTVTLPYSKLIFWNGTII